MTAASEATPPIPSRTHTTVGVLYSSFEAFLHVAIGVLGDVVALGHAGAYLLRVRLRRASCAVWKSLHVDQEDRWARRSAPRSWTPAHQHHRRHDPGRAARGPARRAPGPRRARGLHETRDHASSSRRISTAEARLTRPRYLYIDLCMPRTAKTKPRLRPLMVLISDKQRAALLAKARPLGQSLSTYVRRTLGIEETEQ